MSNYPAIPTPRPDVEALYATVSALKSVIDILTGSVGGASPAMRIYIQAEAPAGASAGDTWLRTSDRNLLIYNAANSNWIATL